MAIKFVEEKDAPLRLHARSGVSGTRDFSDTLQAIRTIPQGKAIVVTMDEKAYANVKKPETTFAYAIRRFLAKGGIAATAYQSGKFEVTIRRDAAGSAPKKRGK